MMKNSIIKLLKLFKLYSVARAVKHLIDHYQNIRYHKAALHLYSEFIRKGDLCFDVGANIGNRTKLFLEIEAKILCVEPQQVCLQHLYKLFKNNRDVIIVAKAITDREGYAEISICEEAPELSTLSDKWKNEGRFSKDFKWTTTQKVPTTTLDTLIEQYGLPVFCKIDVEGFEVSILKGLTKPIPVISFEFTREFFNDTKQCIDLISNLGPVEFNCALGEKMKLLFPTWVEPIELYKKLDSLSNKNLWGEIYAKFI